jgi:hypothetical protein
MSDLRTVDDDTPPILAHKHYRSPSAFTLEGLLREARRQKVERRRLRTDQQNFLPSCFHSAATGAMET